MVGVDGGFAGRTQRDLVTGHVIDDVEEGESPVFGRRSADFPYCACGLKLPACNRIDREADLGLEYAARYALEQNFGLIAGKNPLQGVRLERGCQSPISLAVVDKNHGWTEGHGDHLHARPQRELGALMPRLGDLGRNVVDRDDAVEQHDHDKKQQTERDIVQ